jgi:arsenate reductase (thioredoxin)
MGAKKKVLFVCIGNSCRSQMAEGFARRYGGDVMMAQSAGLYPAGTVSQLTIATMKKRNIDMSGVWPKSIFEAPGAPFDLIVNISGYPLPGEIQAASIEWTVRDPIAFGEAIYEEVADKIEGLVMSLILQLRSAAPSPPANAAAAEAPKSDGGPVPIGPGGSRMYRRGRGQN